MDDPVTLSRLAKDVRRHCGRGKVLPETGTDAAAFGGQRVTIEHELDRDHNAFTD